MDPVSAEVATASAVSGLDISASVACNEGGSGGGGDDSDTDIVTDFLNSNCCTTNEANNDAGTVYAKGDNTTVTPISTVAVKTTPQPSMTGGKPNYCIPIIHTPSPPPPALPAGTNNHNNNNNNNNSGLCGNITTTNNRHNNNNSNASNMIPIINVTPHSPAPITKYNNIFEDTLSQLQNIRESVVQMKNSSAHMQNGHHHHHHGVSGGGGGSGSGGGGGYSLLQDAAMLSSSLPDLNGGGGGDGLALGMGECNNSGATNFGRMSQLFAWRTPHQYFLNAIADRRRSWTAVDDLLACGGVGAAADGTNNSVSLSSLDSEEQETIRVAEQRRRATRNSTGGISTHSLNEAELARDFERIATKRTLNAAEAAANRITLQKSISTSSIIAKEDIKAIQRHLTDSEDENQSLLRSHTHKTEVYSDNVEKRRKRGSLFFRKKNKDKVKLKMSNQAGGGSGGVGAGGHSGMGICEACGASVALENAKEHVLECRAHSKKSGGGGSRLPFSSNMGSSSGGGSGGKGKSSDEFFDGVSTCEPLHNFGDDNTPLIRSEFLNEPPIDAQDLGADPALGITLEEHDSWSPGIPKELLKTLKEKQIKRQEHIYEFIMTEKHHCQTLIVMQKLFVESLERYFPTLNVNSMFPRLRELTELHTAFLKRLRQKQREQHVVDSIADILLEFFSDKVQHLRLSYGEFCANHRSALEQFKLWLTSRDTPFAEWYKHCLTNPLLKKKGIPECILFVTQRLTKYPLLIEPLLKSGREDRLETEKLQLALSLVKSLLFDVDACVAEKELRERQIELFNRMDGKTFAIYKNKPFRKLDVGIESRRRLKFEGLATLMQGRSKMQLVLVMVLTDCLCFLSENSAHKYTFFTPEHKAGVVPLQKLLIREKAGTESRGIYIISSNPAFPEMYELKVQQPKDKNVWIQSIRLAVLECPSTDLIETENLTTEEKLRIGVNKRELIEKIKQKDIEQALLLEEKIILHLSLLKEQKTFGGGPISTSTNLSGEDSTSAAGGNLVSAASFLAALGTYRDLVGVDCDTGELWKRVLSNVQNIGQLASSVYTAATGLPVSRSVSSVGEKQSDNYASPTLPKRAETFAGFDERRGGAGSAVTGNATSKTNAPMFTCNSQMMTPRLQELEEKPREPRNGKDRSGGGGAMQEQLIQLTEQQHLALDQAYLKEHNYAALQINHHLHTLLCIISQQMTVIHNLQLQLALYRENPRGCSGGGGSGGGGNQRSYTHNDQLEELRNLQDRLQEEKTTWLRTKDQQEQDLEERRQQLEKLNEKIKLEQEDIKQQREQLYRKMELLSNQGLLLSPSTPLAMIACPPALSAAGMGMNSTPLAGISGRGDGNDEEHEHVGGTNDTLSISSTITPHTTADRRKDKWRTASTISKTPPGNLLSATNAPKTGHTNVKQKIPIKLSSLSSSSSSPVTSLGAATSTIGSSSGGKVDKSASFNTSAGGGSGVTQIFPLKLADVRQQQQQRSALNASTSFSGGAQITPQHSRTGSSPAIIQQHPVATTTTGAGGAGAGGKGGISRNDTFSYNPTKHHNQQHHTPGHSTTTSSSGQSTKHTRSSSMASNNSSSTSAIPVTTTSHSTTPSSSRTKSGGGGTVAGKARADEEEIYF